MTACWRRCWSVVLWIGVAATVSPAPAQFEFPRHDIDLNYGGNGKPGWVRAADMDGDGDVDIVAGGGYALYVYEDLGLGGWERHGSLDATEGPAPTERCCSTPMTTAILMSYTPGIAGALVGGRIPGGYASHQLQVADINQDDPPDVISEGCGHATVSYSESVAP